MFSSGKFSFYTFSGLHNSSPFLDILQWGRRPGKQIRGHREDARPVNGLKLVQIFQSEVKIKVVFSTYLKSSSFHTDFDISNIKCIAFPNHSIAQFAWVGGGGGGWGSTEQTSRNRDCILSSHIPLRFRRVCRKLSKSSG